MKKMRGRADDEGHAGRRSGVIVDQPTELADAPAGIFRNEKTPAIGYEVDFRRSTATILFGQTRGRAFELHRDDNGERHIVTPTANARVYFSVIDANTIRIGPAGEAGIVLRRWSE